jgi:signal recognition particle GTPase
MHSSKFERPGSCDLLICDEAHRLKNDQTLTNKVCQFTDVIYTHYSSTLGVPLRLCSAETAKMHNV